MQSAVEFERDQGLARITLNRPERGNAINLGLAQDLLSAALICHEDRTIRCVLLASRGKNFCVGGDISSFTNAGDDIGRKIKELTTYLHAAITHLCRMQKPLVTAVNGVAAGAGLSLAVMGDIAVAASSAQFRYAYTTLGFAPDGGASWLLPRLIGLRRTQELALLNRPITSETAAETGLITRSVSDEMLARESESIAYALSKGPTQAFGHLRRLLLSSMANEFATHLELESQAIASSAASVDGHEGINAFLEKRVPDFLG